MGRSADIKTKPVATRVPMADYIKILQESSAKGISVSDYVSLKLSSETKLEHGGSLDLESDTVKTLKSKVIELEKEISALKSKKTTISGNLDKDKIKNILSRNPNLKIENYNLDTQAEKNPKLKPFCLECYEISKLING
jgi:hypothetical protein